MVFSLTFSSCNKFFHSFGQYYWKINKNHVCTPHNRQMLKRRSYNTTITSDERNRKTPLLSKQDHEYFDGEFSNIVKILMSDKYLNGSEEIATRYLKSLHYNVPHGKKNRGLAVVTTYKILEKPERLTIENLKLSCILGWTVEFLQALFLVWDDLTDSSETRRGQPCWYKLDGIGLTAKYDGLLLNAAIYTILKKFFVNHPSYVHFIELFLEATKVTVVGQLLDTNTLNVNQIDMKRYQNISYCKTAYYSFFLPVALGLYFCNITNPEAHRKSREILFEIGKFFQIQDDYLDCFGDPELTGKIGTDIQTGKCSWLAVSTMQIASESQKRIMEENYGKNRPENVEKIKELYLKLDIPKLYADYEEESFTQIQRQMKDLPEELPRELFTQIISTIYKRVK